MFNHLVTGEELPEQLTRMLVSIDPQAAVWGVAVFFIALIPGLLISSKILKDKEKK